MKEQMRKMDRRTISMSASPMELMIMVTDLVGSMYAERNVKKRIVTEDI